MKILIMILSLVLIQADAFANCNDLGPKEKRECKKSKTEEGQCKGVVKKVLLGYKQMDKKQMGSVMSDCLKEMQSFCGDRSFYKGCKIEARGKSCTLWKMNETRTEAEGSIAFPKKMSCMKKYI